MAYPRQLVHTVSATLGMAEGSIIQLDRQLQEAGLRRKGGRGRSSVHVDAGDAAALLIGVAGAPLFAASIAGAAETVRKYSELPSAGKAPDARAPLNSARERIPALGKLSERHTFGEALRLLIEAATDDELDLASPLHISDGTTPLAAKGRAEVHFGGPWPYAAIMIFLGEGWIGDFYREQPPNDVREIMGWAQNQEIKHGTSDFRERRNFSDRTLQAVGDLLAGRRS